MNTKLFVRDICDKEKYKQYKDKMINIYHFSSINSYSKFKIKKLLNTIDLNYCIQYRFEILKKWIDKNNVNKLLFFSQLKTNINKLFLQNLLSSSEISYLNGLEYEIFTKERNLKDLVVDFATYKDEKVYFYYEDIRAYQIINNKKINLINYGDLFLSNKRVIFANFLGFYNIAIKNILLYKIEDDYLILTLKDYHQFAIQYMNNNVLLISFKRLFKRKEN